MRKLTGRRRPARVLGSFLVVALVASGAVLALGGGVASASTSGWSVVGSPISLAQNTQGNEFITDGKVVPNNSSRSYTVTLAAPNLLTVTGGPSSDDLTQGDEGRLISGSGIIPGTYVEDVTSTTTATLSRPVTPGTGVSVTITAAITGAGAALHFDVPSWSTGESITITASPDDHGDAGKQCATTGQPEGVNQSDEQLGNYVGFSHLATYLDDTEDQRLRTVRV